MENRKQAMKWWIDLPNNKQRELSLTYYNRDSSSLTGREIEKIYHEKYILLQDLMEQTFHCDDDTAKKIVDTQIQNNPKLLLFFDISYLYKV